MVVVIMEEVAKVEAEPMATVRVGVVRAAVGVTEVAEMARVEVETAAAARATEVVEMVVEAAAEGVCPADTLQHTVRCKFP